RDFVETFNIPFAETQAGKSAIESTHTLNLGGIGVTGNAAANTIAKSADLVIGIGTRFTDFTTASKHLFQSENVDFITINISEFHAGKLDATQVVADAKTTLEALAEKLKEAGYKSSYDDEIKTAKETWQAELKRLSETNYKAEDFKPEVAGHMDDT